MHSLLHGVPFHASRCFLLILLTSIFSSVSSRCQDSGGEGTLRRGDRAEISVTLRDSSGAVITAPATASLYRSGGIPVGKSAVSRGRAFFVVPSLGEYTLTVQATGYKVSQKDISVLAAVRIEVDVYLQDSSTPASVPGSSTPVLAPKAKELFDRAVQALGQDKLDEAEKYIGETLRLAPSHPNVLYIQGVLLLMRRNWAESQVVLEKAS